MSYVAIVCNNLLRRLIYLFKHGLACPFLDQIETDFPKPVPSWCLLPRIPLARPIVLKIGTRNQTLTDVGVQPCTNPVATRFKRFKTGHLTVTTDMN